MSEQAIKIAAQLYECRDTARTILGNRYAEKMKSYGNMIRAVAEHENISEVAAATKIAKVAGDAMQTMIVMAAYVELVEPTVQAAA